MIALTSSEITSLQNAKASYKKYQYGSLYYKRAFKRYVSLCYKLAQKYNCSISDIKFSERFQK